MFDDERFGARVHVLDGVGLGFFGARLGGKDAAIGPDLTNLALFAVEVGGDAGAEIDAVGDEPFVPGLDRFDERFAGVGSVVEDGDGATVERLAGVVGDFRGRAGIGLGLVVVDE